MANETVCYTRTDTQYFFCPDGTVYRRNKDEKERKPLQRATYVSPKVAKQLLSKEYKINPLKSENVFFQRNFPKEGGFVIYQDVSGKYFRSSRVYNIKNPQATSLEEQVTFTEEVDKGFLELIEEELGKD